MPPHGLHNLTTDGPADDYHPLWSQDGSPIACRSRRTDGITDIWFREADGSSPRTLTADGRDAASYPHPCPRQALPTHP